MAKDTIKNQCQQLWEKARTTPIILQFTSKPEMDRAGFTLYSACPRQDRTELELTKDRKKFTLTIQLKTLNTYHDTFAGELNKALGGGQQIAESGERAGEVEGITDDEVEESLRRMQDKLDQESDKPRPATPYFNRNKED